MASRRQSRNTSLILPFTTFSILFAIGLIALNPGIVFNFLLPDDRSSTTADAAAGVVAGKLERWQVLKPGPDVLPPPIRSRLRGVNGELTRGWNGDGEYWYEVELSPDLAAELRTALQSSNLKQIEGLPGGESSPPWWPKGKTPDLRSYSSAPPNGGDIIISESRNSAWLYGWH